MDTRNNQHRKRRVELTNEELQEKRRKAAQYQRQYRARQKAELQNNKTTSIANQDSGGVIIQPSTTASANLGTGLSTIVQIDDSEEPTDWLHKNDTKMIIMFLHVGNHLLQLRQVCTSRTLCFSILCFIFFL